jgi:thioredoxin 1
MHQEGVGNPMAAPIHITDATFESEVIQAAIPTIVDFWAEWCMPCKRIAPILDELATEHASQLKVVKMDVDSNPATPERFNITGIPTLLVFKQGELVETLVGFLPKDRLLAKLSSHLR